MNAHLLRANVPLDKLFGDPHSPGEVENVSPGTTGQMTKTFSDKPGAKPSYLSSAINWDQGVLHWGLND